MQEYFYEDDAVRVVHTLQDCDPIVREPFRLEVREGVIRHMRCTVLMDGDLLTWSFEDVHELTLLREKAKTLQTLPKEYGHEMNNFLTVIGSAAEGIQLDATEPLMKEDAEAILSMTERAAVLTRQFMHLGRKSQLPQSIVNLSERLYAEQHRLQRLINANVSIAIQDKDAHVFASSYLLEIFGWLPSKNFETRTSRFRYLSHTCPITFRVVYLVCLQVFTSLYRYLNKVKRGLWIRFSMREMSNRERVMPFKVHGSPLHDVVVDFASIKMHLVHDVYRFSCRGFEQSSSER